MRIKYKIIISFYCLILAISLILGSYSYYISQKSIINKVSISNIEITKQINSSINFMQKDINDVSNFVSLDENVQTILNSDISEKNVTHDNHYLPNMISPDTFWTFMENVIASKSYISLMVLYKNDDSFTPYFINTSLYYGGSSGYGANKFSFIQRSVEYKKILDAKGAPVWFSPKDGKQPFIKDYSSSRVFMGKIVKNTNTLNNIGLLVLGLDEKSLRNIYVNNANPYNESIDIVDSEGNLVSHSGPDFYTKVSDKKFFMSKTLKNNEGFFVDNYTGNETLSAYSRNNIFNWTIFYTVSAADLTSKVNSIKTYTVILVTSCIIFSFPIMLLITTLLTAPIKELCKSMKHFQKGNFDERVNFKYKDEIGELGDGYNNMVSEIKRLVETVYIYQIKGREAELNALQAQINPHFMYNTLDTILMKAEGSNRPEIADMIYSLSRMLRLSLNCGKNFTLVSKEKELIEHYLLLQKIRFKSKLNYEIRIEDDILNDIIPKLILQPFVENSVLHGLEKKKKEGLIVVTGVKEGSLLKFTIEDNGMGIEPEKLEKLLLPNNDSNVETSIVSLGGYAVRNVNERLKLAYNDKCSLKISSKIGEGTLIEILVPIKEYTGTIGSKL
ncbi:MAG TPA: sensor histidine kinase [Ruminiclostridium sp.]